MSTRAKRISFYTDNEWFIPNYWLRIINALYFKAVARPLMTTKLSMATNSSVTSTYCAVFQNQKLLVKSRPTWKIFSLIIYYLSIRHPPIFSAFWLRILVCPMLFRNPMFYQRWFFPPLAFNLSPGPLDNKNHFELTFESLDFDVAVVCSVKTAMMLARESLIISRVAWFTFYQTLWHVITAHIKNFFL